ncbi:MAG: SDR family NAD(P)-dependent oxidoreductase [Syntrophales bacterium]
MNYLDQFNLTDKVAIVTGGSKGLGRAMAIGLAGAGAKTVVVSRSKNLIEETAQEIVKAGGEAIAIPVNVRSDIDIERMAQAVGKKFGRIDILVNNAGIAPTNDAVDIPLEEWNNVMDTNLKSIFLTAKIIGKKMLNQKQGKVINIGSVLGKGALLQCVHYSASKAAIMQMTRSLALEWAPFNINVNCIAPGFFSTEMTKAQFENEIERKFLLRKIPFKRFGKPEDIIGLAIFLSSPASDYITGETVFIDGGYSIW